MEKKVLTEEEIKMLLDRRQRNPNTLDDGTKVWHYYIRKDGISYSMDVPRSAVEKRINDKNKRNEIFEEYLENNSIIPVGVFSFDYQGTVPNQTFKNINENIVTPALLHAGNRSKITKGMDDDQKKRFKKYY